MTSKLLETLSHAILTGYRDTRSPHQSELAGQPGVVELVNQALSSGIAVDTILQDGMVSGMEVVGNKFSNGEYFLPDLLMSAQAMKAGMQILEPLLKGANVRRRGKVIIGTVQGDIHDIGKNLVSVILEGGGFEILDLGVDVPAAKFVETAGKHPEAVVGMSALITTTRESMRATLEQIRGAGLSNKVIIGGAVVTRAYADEIGADGFTKDAGKVVNLVRELQAVET